MTEALLNARVTLHAGDCLDVAVEGPRDWSQLDCVREGGDAG